MLKDEAHSQKAADAAVGLGTDNGRKEAVDSGLGHAAMEDVQV